MHEIFVAKGNSGIKLVLNLLCFATIHCSISFLTICFIRLTKNFTPLVINASLGRRLRIVAFSSTIFHSDFAEGASCPTKTLFWVVTLKSASILPNFAYGSSPASVSLWIVADRCDFIGTELLSRLTKTAPQNS